jgi:hypothetical protein
LACLRRDVLLEGLFLSRRGVRIHILTSRVDQHHGGDLVGVLQCKHAHVFATKRVPHQHVGACDACVGEERVQLAGDLAGGARLWAWVAPAHAGAVVGTHAGAAAKRWLDEIPIERRAAEPGVEHDRRAARADTLDMQPVATDVNQLAGRGIATRIPRRGDRLVAGPGQREHGDQSKQRGQRASDPAQYPLPAVPGRGWWVQRVRYSRHSDILQYVAVYVLWSEALAARVKQRAF